MHLTFKFRETWSNQQSPMPCTILIIQTLRHSWICLGEKKTKKKLETIQREVDLPLPVARFHDLFNGPYLLVARCFICTRIFFACLPASHCSLPGRWWLFSPVVIGFFFPLGSAAAPENRQITASLPVAFGHAAAAAAVLCSTGRDPFARMLIDLNACWKFNYAIITRNHC